jgi:hypothetical protein
MTKTIPTASRNVLRWIFRRDNNFIACELIRMNNRQYSLALVPINDRSQGASEIFHSGLEAFHRHATVASTLRESGWKVVAYTGPSPFTPDYAPSMERPAA